MGSVPSVEEAIEYFEAETRTELRRIRDLASRGEGEPIYTARVTRIANSVLASIDGARERLMLAIEREFHVHLERPED